MAFKAPKRKIRPRTKICTILENSRQEENMYLLGLIKNLLPSRNMADRVPDGSRMLRAGFSKMIQGRGPLKKPIHGVQTFVYFYAR